MIDVYFFIKCVVRWSENFVRFEKSYGNWLPDGPNSVRYGMNGSTLHIFSSEHLKIKLTLTAGVRST